VIPTNVTINSNSVRGRREAALQQANIGSGFYNLVNGQHLVVAQTLDVIDPVTGKALAKVPDVDQSDLDSAVEAAAVAFRSWSRTPWDVRKAVVGRVVEALGEHMDELATLLAAEGGRSIGMADWEIKWITDLYGPSLLATELTEERWVEERVGQVVKRYVPLGVVCAISPWNLPFLLSFVKVLPALLVGDTVVLKPSPFTPLTVLRAADYIRELLPAGVFNVITGGDRLGPWMTAHPGFNKIAFTGSTQTGRRVLGAAADTLKHVTLELGGNDPGIVLPDTDPQAIAEPLFWSMFMLNGQGCITLKRLFVHEDLYDALTQTICACAARQRVGDGFDPEATLGPIQNRPQLDRLNTAWDEIRRDGAAVLFRGESPAGAEGLFFPITILDNPRHDAAYVRQENFGPLRSIIKYRSLEEAIQKANDTPYGLGASVWGRDPATLDAVARRLEAGTIWINQHLNPHPDVPFTGHKASGLGVEFATEGLRDFCNLQIIATRR
jgi:acyl-CoA reductase-like NAD-dependent aldehyde dehydrogenase